MWNESHAKEEIRTLGLKNCLSKYFGKQLYGKEFQFTSSFGKNYFKVQNVKRTFIYTIPDPLMLNLTATNLTAKMIF